MGRKPLGDAPLTLEARQARARSKRQLRQRLEVSAAVAGILDRIATMNAGTVARHGRRFVLVEYDDWEALMKARGTPEQVLARMDGRAAGDGS